MRNLFQIENEYISSIAVKALKLVSNFIGIKTDFRGNFSIYKNQHLTSQERVLDICIMKKRIII